ncbi:MAG: hypothetical protein IJJ00_05060 [Erysipelotrichaceae bacterium]|nr:hypothetical protein [Erysipelotrichaceae bacterium]
MTNEEMRKIQSDLNLNYFKINYKTGVHYWKIEDFFNGKTDELEEKDRVKIVEMLKGEVKRHK